MALHTKQFWIFFFEKCLIFCDHFFQKGITYIWENAQMFSYSLVHFDQCRQYICNPQPNQEI